MVTTAVMTRFAGQGFTYIGKVLSTPSPAKMPPAPPSTPTTAAAAELHAR